MRAFDGNRIVFNGQEYASTEAMPAGVRQAYEQAISLLKDADRNGIPDILEGGAPGNVVIRQSSITINGHTLGSPKEMPAPMRELYEQATAPLPGGGGSDPGGSAPESLASSRGTGIRLELGDVANALGIRQNRPTTEFNQIDQTLTAILRGLLVVVAGAVLAGAVFLMVIMDTGSRSQGGRVYVALAAVVVLGAIDTSYERLVRRRLSFLESTPWRYRLLSLFLLLASAAALLGLAIFLP